MVGITSRFAALGRSSARPRDPSGDSVPRLPWPMPLIPLIGISAVMMFGWWRLAHQQLALVSGVPTDPGFAATFATFARLGGNAVESAYYVLSWRAFGHRIPYLRMLAWIVLLSGADLLAWEMRQHHFAARGAVPTWVAIVSGIGGLPGSWLPRAFHTAFGSAGLLTLARILFTARTQTLATRVPLARTFAFTAATWFLTHLVLGFGYALLQGRSVPGMP